jgi:EamA domain-containing membrane protein RarD
VSRAVTFAFIWAALLIFTTEGLYHARAVRRLGGVGTA